MKPEEVLGAAIRTLFAIGKEEGVMVAGTEAAKASKDIETLRAEKDALQAVTRALKAEVKEIREAYEVLEKEARMYEAAAEELKKKNDEMEKLVKEERKEHEEAIETDRNVKDGNFVVGSMIVSGREDSGWPRFVGIHKTGTDWVVEFYALLVTDIDGGRTLLVDCKSYKGKTILFHSKTLTVVASDKGVGVSSMSIKRMEKASSEDMMSIQRMLKKFGLEFDGEMVTNGNWEGVDVDTF